MEKALEELNKLAKEHKTLIIRNRLILKTVSDVLQDLLKRLKDGEGGQIKALIDRQSELATALRRADEIERKYDEWLAGHTGALAAGEIDLDSLRDEIGGRLDQLRDEGGAEDVS